MTRRWTGSLISIGPEILENIKPITLNLWTRLQHYTSVTVLKAVDLLRCTSIHIS